MKDIKGMFSTQSVGETHSIAQNKTPTNSLSAPVSTEEQNHTSPLPKT